MEWIWLIIIILAVVFEFFTVEIVGIWFAVAAVFAYLSAVLLVPPFFQIILFFAISTITIAVTRPIVIKYIKPVTAKTNIDKYFGRHAIVTKIIAPDVRGEIKIDNDTWMAINYDNEVIAVGETVIINSVEGVKFIVSKLLKEEEHHE